MVAVGVAVGVVVAVVVVVVVGVGAVVGVVVGVAVVVVVGAVVGVAVGVAVVVGVGVGMKDRTRSVGASESACLFPERGGSPWQSEYGLWAQKSGLVVEADEKTERQSMGLKLEWPILQIWADDSARSIVRNQQSIAWPYDAHITATPDAFEVIEDPTEGGAPVLFRARRVACIDAKTVQPWARRKWQTEGLPFHYWCQLQQQMLVFDLHFAYLVAIFGVDAIEHQHVRRDEEFQNELIARIKLFWRRVEGKEPPPDVDDHESTRLALLGREREQKTIALDESLRELHSRSTLAAKTRLVATKDEKAAKAEIMAALGDADCGVWADGSGYRVIEKSRGDKKHKELKFFKSDQTEEGDE